MPSVIDINGKAIRVMGTGKTEEDSCIYSRDNISFQLVKYDKPMNLDQCMNDKNVSQDWKDECTNNNIDQGFCDQFDGEILMFNNGALVHEFSVHRNPKLTRRISDSFNGTRIAGIFDELFNQFARN